MIHVRCIIKVAGGILRAAMCRSQLEGRRARGLHLGGSRRRKWNAAAVLVVSCRGGCGLELIRHRAVPCTARCRR